MSTQALSNLYAILGVPAEATQDDIREAYRIAARRFHPDANANEGAEHQFRDIAAAYEVLGNPQRRYAYDEGRRATGDEPAYFSLRVTPSKRVLAALDEPQVLYLLLEIAPLRELAKQQKRAVPLNLTLVLDRSKSMKGIRLDKLKIAAHQIIESLSPEDRLALISFSDRAEVLIPAAPVTDTIALRAQVNLMRADGGTEIFHGLQAGIDECRKHLSDRFVNHVVLLTDGRTFGDEERALELASQAAAEGIGISAMGIGEEWNDEFLDALASRTGGTSTYVTSPTAVVRFLNERVRSLGDTLVERLKLCVAPDADIVLESLFKLQPNPQPMELSPQPVPLGSLEFNRTLMCLVQLQMPPGKRTGFRTVARIDVTGSVLIAERQGYKVLSDISVEIASNPPPEDPPIPILDALGKLTLYRIQEKAQQSLQKGNIAEATRRLENLATRLLASGQEELAQMAIIEARRVASTSLLSEEGRKTLKFGTRRLLSQPDPRDPDP
ncbi:MAG: DnaJ domain-containing protein [Chloroflexota bacterium]|nr:VWA domain-containing protein [Anaerolineae bacterium]HMM28440.1 VWA domain-containing protein [Aggregatilineaceae bacterium]